MLLNDDLSRAIAAAVKKVDWSDDCEAVGHALFHHFERMTILASGGFND